MGTFRIPLHAASFFFNLNLFILIRGLYHLLYLLVMPSSWKNSLVFVFYIFLLFWKFLNFLKIYFQGIYFAECLSTGVYKKGSSFLAGILQK